MTRLTKTSLFAVLGLTVAAAGATDVLACGRGGGGGYRGGYSGGYGGGNYSYSRPVYSQPSYSQPVYSQPVYSQPVQQQPVQPIVGQPQFQGQQPVQQQPQFQGQQPVQQQQPQFQAQQPAQQQQPQIQGQQPVQQQPIQTAQTSQPQQAPATQPQQAPTTQPQQSAGNAQQSALDILSNFAGTEATQTSTTTPQPQGFSGIGTWSATLTNGSTIQLELRADSTFTWTAIKSGNQSTFSGTYTLTGESLTLTRNDSQQLTGSLLVANTNGFTFKLDGVKDNGLQFARS